MNYYTPDISDFFVGYECEILYPFNKAETEYSFKYNPNPSEDRWVEHVFKHGHIDSWEGILIETIDEYRTSYLTKEQIEAEGWTLLPPSSYLPYARPEEQLDRLYKNGWSIQHKPFKKILVIINHVEMIQYFGKCPSINEFRKICKLIGI